MGIENHAVRVIRISELEKHPNADSLSIVRIGGYQVVVRTDEWKVGDLAAYVQPDSVVPPEPQYAFLWENMTFENNEVPLKRRRITARRFRKEWSEGLLLHIGSQVKAYGTEEICQVAEGQDVAELLGITHYEPPEEPESTTGENEPAPGSRQNKHWPRSLKGWLIFLVRVITLGLYDYNGPTGGENAQAPHNFRPVYDVEALKNYATVFEPDEPVMITEKIHGSNARYTFTEGKMYAGSRKLWKSEKSNCVWRRVLQQHAWIEEWCRAHPDFTLYGEVVPTQGGFNYGCKDGETKFFVFDVLTPTGEWVPGIYKDPAVKEDGPLASHMVPVLAVRPYNEELVKTLVDGKSTVEGTTHIREGIVIRPVTERYARNLGRVQLKIVSNSFLLKDSE